MNCVFCGIEINTKGNPGRGDVCFNCKRDLRCCKQCKFYDPGSYNECREVLAERIVDKERANFCDYFVPRGSALTKVNKTQEAIKALENLFRK
ncbi:MAG TPA: hypothetical protein PK874_00590 [Desulfobacteraceae bacterium]|mgnify:CR=1 FL=1|jgi:hypothetical protein|nr:hypothetical protein [Desulfobacteraceae bacterium]HPJ68806.1 hypothetical protein [Desulfobacteraceae bacterium]HPQ27631.1 hypothetical protein [Desulfobacteraceae bacterium]